MYAWGHKRSICDRRATSALTPEADISVRRTQRANTGRERAEPGGNFGRSRRRSASRLWSLGHHGTS